MYHDKALMFDEANAITVTRDSTNVIDLLKTAQNIGVGEELYIAVTVTTAFVTGDAATLQIALVTDDNAALDSATVVMDLPAVLAAATLVAGYQRFFHVPVVALERYLGIIYTVGTGSYSAGAVTAGIVKDIQANKAYPNNMVTA